MLAKIEIPQAEVTSLHSMEPWLIGRYVRNMKNTAINSLSREGIETWYPTYRDVRRTPLRKIPPKKRHMASQFFDETIRERFPGYIFLRRAMGSYDINRLFDLAGCGGIVTIGGVPAKVADHDIEIMRMHEADGKYNAIELSEGKRYRINRLDEKAMQQWDGHNKLDGRLDDSGDTILRVEAFGRVERIIATADAL